MSLSDIISRLTGTKKEEKSKPLPGINDLKRYSSMLEDMDSVVSLLTKRLVGMTEEIRDASVAVRTAAVAQTVFKRSMQGASDVAEEYTDSVEELNTKLSDTKKKGKDAGVELTKFSDILQKGNDLLGQHGLEIAKFFGAAYLYNMHILEPAKINLEVMSKGNAALASYQPGMVNAWKQAQITKNALDAVGDAAVQSGMDQEEAQQIASYALANLNQRLESMTDPKNVQSLARLTKQISGVAFITGQSTDAVGNLINQFTGKANISQDNVLNSLALMREEMDAMRKDNTGFTYSTEELVDSYLEAAKGIDSYNMDLKFLGKTMRSVIEDTTKLTGSQDKAKKVFQNISGFLAKPPEWLDTQVSLSFLSEAQQNLDKFLTKMGAESKRAEIEEYLKSNESGYTKSLLINEALKGTAGYNQAIVDKLRQSGGNSATALQAMSGGQLDAASAYELNKQLKNGNIDKFIGESLSAPKDAAGEAHGQELIETGTALAQTTRNASKDLQGLMSLFENYSRSNWLLGAVLGIGGIKIGMAAIRGGGAALGALLGGGRKTTSKGKSIIKSIVSRLLGDKAGSAVSTVTDALGLTSSSGTTGDCVKLCEGSCGGGSGAADDGNALLDKAKEAAEEKIKEKAGGLFGAGGMFAARSTMLGTIVSRIPLIAAAISAFSEVPKIIGAWTDKTKSFGDAAVQTSDSIGEIGLAFGTAGASLLAKWVMGDKAWDKMKDDTTSYLSDLGFRLDELVGGKNSEKWALLSRGNTNKAAVQADRSLVTTGTTAQAELSRLIWDDNGNLKPEYKYLASTLPEQITDAYASSMLMKLKGSKGVFANANYMNSVASMPRLQNSMPPSTGGIKELTFDEGKVDAQGNLIGTATYKLKGFGSNVLGVTRHAEHWAART